VDSLKLLEEINKQARKNNRIIDCLLQMYIAEEESKFGLDEEELDEILHFVQTRGKAEQSEANGKNGMKNIRIVGLMGMATYTDNQNQIKKEFTHLKTLFDKLQSRSTDAINRVSTWQTVSMGMSGDYQLAIECGSTMVRIGSSIFGG
jgi:PLP dependent protein